MDLKLRKKLVKCYIWSIALCGAEPGSFGQIRNTWKVLKCAAGEGRRRSVGPITQEMKKYYLQSRSRGISYMKLNRRLTGLVTFYVETAFYNGLLKER
jgi:hypothetical protein